MHQVTHKVREVPPKWLLCIFQSVDFGLNVSQKAQKTVSVNVNVPMHFDSFIFSSNKEHIEEMKRANDEKLADLNAKLDDCESTLKSHRRELSVWHCFFITQHLIWKKSSKFFIMQSFSDLHKHPWEVQHRTECDERQPGYFVWRKEYVFSASLAA